jgi:hypothetical protein
MRRMVDSGRATAAGVVKYVFYIDDDDHASAEMAETLNDEGNDIRYVWGPRILLSSMWNECQKIARYDVFQQSCDETIYRSDGWDTAVLDAFGQWPDRIGLVYGRDGIHDQNLATHGFITRQWVDAVGYFVPPYFSSDYNDLWLMQVAQGIGRTCFLPDVYAEHMHPAVGKGPLDQTHQDRLARHGQDNVDQLWKSLLPKRQEDVAKLLTAISEASG